MRPETRNRSDCVSLAEDIARKIEGIDDPDELSAILAAAREAHVKRHGRPWDRQARNKQLPPDNPRHHEPYTNPVTGETFRCTDPVCQSGKTDNDWRIWVNCAGRGYGKTRCGAGWITGEALKYPGTRWVVAAPTAEELQSVCIEGDSGILSFLLPGELRDYNINKKRILLANNSIIQGFSADTPNRVRGQNAYGLWFDEAGNARYQLEFFRETARLAVRKSAGNGHKARIVITTTPKPTQLMRDLIGRKYGHTHITTGSMWENPTLDEELVEEYKRDYAGSRVGRQELEGELLDDFEGALFSRKDLENHRIPADSELPPLTRVVVAVDPAMTSGENADESGIIVAASAMMDGRESIIVLDDKSLRGTPAEVSNAALRAYKRWNASCLYYEANQGGEWIASGIRTVDSAVSVRKVTSRQSKTARAEPVSILSEQGRLHLYGLFPQLEDQLVTMVPNQPIRKSPDRADSLVIAVTALGLASQGSYMAAYHRISCAECEFNYSDRLAKCPKCGHERVTEKDATLPADKSWASAYGSRCPNCHGAYPRNLTKCPKCYQDPAALIAQAQAMNGTGRPGDTPQAPGSYRQWTKAGSSLRGIWKSGAY